MERLTVSGMQVWEFFFEPVLSGRSSSRRARAGSVTSEESSLALLQTVVSGLGYSSRVLLCIPGLIRARCPGQTLEPASSNAAGLAHWLPTTRTVSSAPNRTVVRSTWLSQANSWAQQRSTPLLATRATVRTMAIRAP